MSRQAVFIDLQGTLGGDPLGDILNFSFYDFSIEAIKLLNKNSLLVFIITNQSNIAKGYLTMEQYENCVKELIHELELRGAKVDGIYCCPHGRNDECDCKKPLPGLVKQAQKDYAIDLSKSYVVGDMGCTDMILAKNIGAKGILVRTGVGEGSLNEFRHTWQDATANYVADNILDAVNWILSKKL